MKNVFVEQTQASAQLFDYLFHDACVRRLQGCQAAFIKSKLWYRMIDFETRRK